MTAGASLGAAPGALALDRRVLLRLLGVRADHCGRSYFVWRAGGVTSAVAGQQFAIAFVADLGAGGAFQCEVTSCEAGGKVSVWRSGARLVGDFILLSACQEESLNEFLRRIEVARGCGVNYVDTPLIAPATGAATRALIESSARRLSPTRDAALRARPVPAEVEFADLRSVW